MWPAGCGPRQEQRCFTIFVFSHLERPKISGELSTDTAVTVGPYRRPTAAARRSNYPGEADITAPVRRGTLRRDLQGPTPAPSYPGVRRIVAARQPARSACCSSGGDTGEHAGRSLDRQGGGAATLGHPLQKLRSRRAWPGQRRAVSLPPPQAKRQGLAGATPAPRAATEATAPADYRHYFRRLNAGRPSAGHLREGERRDRRPSWASGGSPRPRLPPPAHR